MLELTGVAIIALGAFGTFLSFSLETEIEGVLPWQRRKRQREV